jgi:hypothetical protein
MATKRAAKAERDPKPETKPVEEPIAQVKQEPVADENKNLLDRVMALVAPFVGEKGTTEGLEETLTRVLNELKVRRQIEAAQKQSHPR